MSKIAKPTRRPTAVHWTDRKENGRAATRLAARTGYWSAVLLTVLGIGYAAGLLLLMLVYTKQPFTIIEAYAADFNTPEETMYTIVQLFAFLSAPVIVVAGLHPGNDPTGEEDPQPGGAALPPRGPGLVMS